MTTSKSAIMCNHANEMPVECPCDDDCYCKEHSCRNRPTKEQLRQATERFVKQAAEAVKNTPFEQRTILSKAEVRNRPMKYRKKPVVIEAVKITAADYNPLAKEPWDGSPFSEFPSWLEEAVKAETITPHTRNCTDYAEWDIKTLEGTMNATPGDYLIRGVKGELYACKPDIFLELHEPVN